MRRVNVALAILFTATVTAVAVTALLLVRRRAPEGLLRRRRPRVGRVRRPRDGFSVLLGFIVFLAFTSYDQSRSGAETEAMIVVQQVETAQFFPAARAAS